MKRLFLVFALILALAGVSWAHSPLVGVAEEDGSPTVYAYQILFPNAAITDNADGTASVSFPGAGGSAIVLDLADDDSDESADITEIATTGVAGATIFTEPTANKLLIDTDVAWPQAATGDSATAFFSAGTLEYARLPAIDDDTMATATDTTVASSESIKAYVDATAVGLSADAVKNSHIDWADIDNLGEEGLLTVSDTTDTTSFVALFESATGDLAAKTDLGITYNAGTGVLTATGFAGPLTGNVTGNVSGTAATVTGAAQASITSLGTLTVLAVDNITINGNDISSTAGIDLTITPLAGQQIVLDSTIIIDAGVVTGATAITSDAFTGALVGNADTATLAATVTIADNEATNETNAVVFLPGGDLDGGNLALESDGTFNYNPSTGTVTATVFVGSLTGNVTGNADTVTTNANLTGEVTSVGNAATIADSIAVSSWNLTTPTITSGAQFADANITPDANGELVYDNTVAGVDDGSFAYFGGTDTVYYIPGYAVLPTDSEDDYHLAYDKDTDRMYWKADATAGSPTLDTIGAPEAAWGITLQDTETVIWTTQTTATDQFNFDATGNFGDISIFVIEQVTGNPTNGTLLELKTADAEDNVDQLLITNGIDDYVTHHVAESGTYTINVTSDGTALVAITDNVSVTGSVTATTSFIIGSADLNETEMEIIDGATLTTTQLEYLNAATGTTGTASTNLVFSASPTLDSPTFTTTITATDLIDSAHYVADSIDNEHINWADIDNLDNEGMPIDFALTADGTVADNVAIIFGTNSDWNIEYDETTDDRLEFTNIAGTSGDSDVYWDLNDSGADSTFTITNSDATYEADLKVEGTITADQLTLLGVSGTAGFIRVKEDPANQSHFRGWLAQSNFTQQFDHRFPDGEPSANNFYVMGAVGSEITDMSYAGLSTTYFNLGTITAIAPTFLGVAPGTAYTGLTASQVMVDTNGTTDLAHDLLVYSDGTNDYIVVSFVDTDMPGVGEDDYVISYDADANKFYFAAAGGGGSVAWDDITNPDANDEIDFGAFTIEINAEDFRLGDGGANYWRFNDGALTANGTASITLPTLTTPLTQNEDVTIGLDAADEEIAINQTAVAGTADTALIAINDDRTGATANVVAEATIHIDAEGVYAIAAVDGIVYGEDLESGDDVLLADGAVVGITGNEIITFNAAGTINFSGAAVDVDGAFTASTVAADTTVGGTVITASTSHIGPLLDAAGAEDMDYGSADVTDHTFTSDGGTVVLDGGITMGDPGTFLLTDDNDIELDATADGMDDEEYNGIVVGGRNCGEGLNIWDLVYMANDADPWHQADADAAGEFPAFGISVAACTDTNEARILVKGIVRNEAWTGLTPGGAVYLSDTPGVDTGVTQTAPSTSGDAVQIVGFALSDSEIYFDFSRPYQEVP